MICRNNPNSTTSRPTRLLTFLATFIPLGTSLAATLVWEENFDTSAPPAAITTGNTGFGGVRAGNGSINAINSTVGSGSSMQITAATASGTQSGAWVGGGGFGALTAMTMTLSLNLSNFESGALGFYMGNGNTVAGNWTNDNRNPAHFLWDLAIVNTSGVLHLQYRTGSGTYTDTGITLDKNTTYQFAIQANATDGVIDGVNPDTMTIYINGEEKVSGLSLYGAVANANGFRISGRTTTISGDIVAEIDNIQIWNGILPVPEPSSAGLLLTGTALMLLQRRRPGTSET